MIIDWGMLRYAPFPRKPSWILRNHSSSVGLWMAPRPWANQRCATNHSNHGDAARSDVSTCALQRSLWSHWPTLTHDQDGGKLAQSESRHPKAAIFAKYMPTYDWMQLLEKMWEGLNLFDLVGGGKKTESSAHAHGKQTQLPERWSMFAVPFSGYIAAQLALLHLAPYIAAPSAALQCWYSWAYAVGELVELEVPQKGPACPSAPFETAPEMPLPEISSMFLSATVSYQWKHSEARWSMVKDGEGQQLNHLSYANACEYRIHNCKSMCFRVKFLKGIYSTLGQQLRLPTVSCPKNQRCFSFLSLSLCLSLPKLVPWQNLLAQTSTHLIRIAEDFAYGLVCPKTK